MMNDEDTIILNSDGSEYTTDDIEEETQRPNKWQGPPSTWSALTEQERGLAASLDQIRNADLSLHLFIAHALKRRASGFEENPEEVKKDHPAVPDEDQTFVPPKSWTAWPLPTYRVPREGEHIGPPDPDEKYTFRRREVARPSRELEDVILGLTLKFAKERFLTRNEEKNESKQTANFEGKPDDDASVSHDSRDEDGDVVIKEGSAPAQEDLLKPAISIDDDRSRAILRPSIRHTLSKLDETLMALHHARKICLKYSATSEDGEHSEPTTPSKRPRGRPRKFSALTDRSRLQRTPASPGDVDETNLLRTKKTHLGRPLKVYERIEDEPQQDYLVRIARMQKKPLPAFAPPLEAKSEGSPSPSPTRSRRSSVPRATSEERAIKARKRLEPRDWSEVLSSAAFIGFPPDVIARATQRCANLFGEGMVFQTIVETPFMEKAPDVRTRYIPEAIPNFDEDILVSSSEDSDSANDSSLEEETQDQRPISSQSLRSHIPAWRQTCFCPMPDCPRRTKGFKDKDALRKHLELGHEIADEELEDYIIPSDEETNGAVHVDGFLRPLKRFRETRGSYKKSTVKRMRTEDSDDEAGDVEEDVASLRRRSESPAAKVVREETVYMESDDNQDDEDGGASLSP